MTRCGKVCIAEGLFIPEVTEARVPSLPHRNDPTGDHADGNLREDSATQSHSGVFWGFFLPKIKSLMLMHPFLAFNFISGNCL